MSEVTVLLPIHGECPWLEQAIRSLQSQNDADTAILAIFDRPSAASVELTHDLLRSGDSFMESPTSGLANALNAGLERVESPFAGRLDADDIAAPDRFGMQIDFLKQNAGVSAVGSQLSLIDEVGEVVGHLGMPTSHEDIVHRLRWRNAMCHPAVTVRTEIVRSVGGYDSRCTRGQDFQLWLKLAAISQLANIPLELTSYRVHEGQVSNNTPIRSLGPAAVREARVGLARARSESVAMSLVRHQAWRLRYTLRGRR